MKKSDSGRCLLCSALKIGVADMYVKITIWYVICGMVVDYERGT